MESFKYDKNLSMNKDGFKVLQSGVSKEETHRRLSLGALQI